MPPRKRHRAFAIRPGRRQLREGGIAADEVVQVRGAFGDRSKYGRQRRNVSTPRDFGAVSSLELCLAKHLRQS